MAEMPSILRRKSERVRAECDSLGETEVRKKLANGGWSWTEAETARAWLTGKEAEYQEQRRALENRAVAAAERAAESSREAADASRNSARWTLLAAIIALLALAASVIPGCIQNL